MYVIDENSERQLCEQGGELRLVFFVPEELVLVQKFTYVYEFQKISFLIF